MRDVKNVTINRIEHIQETKAMINELVQLENITEVNRTMKLGCCIQTKYATGVVIKGIWRVTFGTETPKIVQNARLRKVSSLKTYVMEAIRWEMGWYSLH